MALILRSIIPRALVKPNYLVSLKMPSSIINTIRDDDFETYCTMILETCVHKPFLENTLSNEGQLIYSSKNIYEIIENMQIDKQIDYKTPLARNLKKKCCGECGKCS